MLIHEYEHTIVCVMASNFRGGPVIGTKAQIADLLTKPHFSVKDWCGLCSLFRLGPAAPTDSLSTSSTAPITTIPQEPMLKGHVRRLIDHYNAGGAKS